MFEIMRHSLGLCGEGHISLLTLFCGGGLVCITTALPFLKPILWRWKGYKNHHHQDDEKP